MIQKPPINTRNYDALLKERHKAFILEPDLINDLSRKEFGANIFFFRNEAKLSLRSLALECHTTKTNLWHIEASDRLPNDSLYLSLVKVLNIPFNRAKKLNELRLAFLLKTKNRNLSDILDLCVNIFKQERNISTDLAINALLKSAIARFELNNDLIEDWHSQQARAAHQESPVYLKIFRKKDILEFMYSEQSLFHSKENILLAICLFSKDIVLTKAEHHRLIESSLEYGPNREYLGNLYNMFNRGGEIVLEPLECFGDNFFDKIWNDLDKRKTLLILRSKL
jgi:transcriptional regulator with XRE-family HTH domain